MNKKTIKRIKEAKKSKADDYTDGYEVCLNCGSYHHLGKGFNKSTVINCPLCKPNKFKIFKCNPFVSSGGLGEFGNGDNKGLRRAFSIEEDYYVSDNGLHLRLKKLIGENYEI